MNVIEVELINFTRHAKSKLTLPRSGIVLITGENGSGKSSFIEGVAFAGWGKTLRGTVPWKGEAKPACTARISTSALNITRSREGKKTELAWEDYEAVAQDIPGAASDDPEYDTTAKAQAALLHLTGPFNLWRRSHVFSSADAAHFTTATDQERKQLIESFLGNDRFDPALEACRLDLKAARERTQHLTRLKEVAEARMVGSKQRIKDAAAQGAALVEPPPAPDVDHSQLIEELDKKMSCLRKNVSDLRNRLRDIDRQGSDHKAAAALARQMLARLQSDKCPTCAQQITASMRDAEKAKIAAAEEQAKVARETVASSASTVESAVQEAEQAIVHLQKERDVRASEMAVAQRAKAEHARYEKQVQAHAAAQASAKAELAKAKAALVTLEEELEVAEQDLEELEAVEVVLGVKGVRAAILGKSLSGIAAIANVWLAKFYAHPVHVTLKPYSELKKGGLDDSISFEVSGVGEGLGYRATSGGERRRLDVAMLLAMAEVAAAARGMTAGTLWFDECLDALDESGIAAVVDALQELARERAVVIITHSMPLKDRLAPAAAVRYHVDRGTVSTY